MVYRHSEAKPKQHRILIVDPAAREADRSPDGLLFGTFSAEWMNSFDIERGQTVDKRPDLILVVGNSMADQALEFCRKLQVHEEYPEVPVILVGSLPGISARKPWYEAGVVDFI